MFQIKVAEKTKTHFLRSVAFTENHAVYETKWTNLVESETPLMTI